MSAINKVKELLADADSNECFTSERASNRIRALAGPLAKELVESQKALKFARARAGVESRHWKRCCPFLRRAIAEIITASDASLRMDGLVKALEG